MSPTIDAEAPGGHSADRLALGIVALLALTAIYMCWCGAPLAWDGAYQLNFTLISQHPYVYLTRFHTAILWRPLVWLSRWTSNPTAIWMAYGLPFLLAPAVAAAASWWILRRSAPRLFLWVLFGIAIAPLPGQMFVINDSILQQHLFWPLFAAVFAPLNARQWLLVAALAVFQFAHQIGAVFFAGIAGVSLVLAILDASRRRQLLLRFALASLLAAAALWKALHFVDPYAKEELTAHAAYLCWTGGVQGLPIRGLLFLWTAAICCFVATLAQPNRRRLWRAGAYLLAAVGGAIWVVWARDPHQWAWESEYRRWVAPLALPFYALCALDYLRGLARVTSPDPAQPSPIPSRFNAPMARLLVGIFVIVLTIQSTLFLSMIRRLRDDLAQFPGPLVPDRAVAWTWHTPLQHWSIFDLAIAVQGKHPTRLLVDRNWVDLLYGLGGLPPVFPNYTLYPHPPRPNSNGWYDLRPILDRLPPARQALRELEGPRREGD